MSASTPQQEQNAPDLETPEMQAPADRSRRDALAAVGKFAAFVAPMTLVLLDSDQAKANHSTSGNPCTPFQIANGHPGC